MGITQLNFELKNKVETAIEDLIRFDEGDNLQYYGAFSGGKDSTAVKLLAKLAKRKVDWHYCVSPIDPPPIHRFIRQYHPDVQWDYHAKGFWKEVQKRQLPLRTQRWCCGMIKEAGGIGRTLITGVRSEESNKRKHYPIFEKDRKQDKYYVRPIVNWSAKEVWELLKLYNEPYCELYDINASGEYKGDGTFQRIGCVLCPMNGDTKTAELYFPKICHLWKLSCDRLLSAGKYSKYGYKSGQELYDWWIARR